MKLKDILERITQRIKGIFHKEYNSKGYLGNSTNNQSELSPNTDLDQDMFGAIPVEELDKSSQYTEDTEMEYQPAEEKTFQYNYSSVDVEVVMKNPDEYIIPECQPACMALWEKGIETFMASNYDDDDLYVVLGELSQENEEKLKKLIKKFPEHYKYTPYRNAYTIAVPSRSKEDSEKLLILTSQLGIQDTVRYKTSEQFLASYKHEGGEFIGVDQHGSLIQEINPARANATLEEALEETGKSDLYIPEEGRIYDSEFYKQWHFRYLRQRQAQVSEKEKVSADGASQVNLSDVSKIPLTSKSQKTQEDNDSNIFEDEQVK